MEAINEMLEGYVCAALTETLIDTSEPAEGFLSDYCKSVSAACLRAMRRDCARIMRELKPHRETLVQAFSDPWQFGFFFWMARHENARAVEESLDYAFASELDRKMLSYGRFEIYLDGEVVRSHHWG